MVMLRPVILWFHFTSVSSIRRSAHHKPPVDSILQRKKICTSSTKQIFFMVSTWKLMSRRHEISPPAVSPSTNLFLSSLNVGCKLARVIAPKWNAKLQRRRRCVVNGYELSDPSCVDADLVGSHVHKMPFLGRKLKSLLLMMIQLLGPRGIHEFSALFALFQTTTYRSIIFCMSTPRRHSRRFRRVITWWLLLVRVPCIAGATSIFYRD